MTLMDRITVGVGLTMLALALISHLALFLIHIGLPRRLRDDLVNLRYFNGFELGLGFPFSMLRTLVLVRAVALPATMKRRFGDYPFEKRAGPVLLALCRGYIGILGLFGVLLIAFFGLTAKLHLEGRLGD